MRKTEEEIIRIELSEGFDRALAESIVQDFMIEKLKGGVATFESSTTGVIALERLSYIDTDKFEWDDLAELLEEKLGIPVAAIEDCDWSFDDRCDEEATYIAFRIPSLEKGYAEETEHAAAAEAVAKP
jgi:hypothetical protein